jgi:carbonic anhydrase
MKMKLSRVFVIGCTLLIFQTAFANEESTENEATQLSGIIKNLMDDNSAFVKSHKPEYFKPFAEKQHPRATVVTCSDSRVQTHALDKTPDGDLFMVRNIGNQISTAEGSVEYGVHHLHTPLLIIVGHVACGAIKAAMSDYSKESEPIKRELNTIKLPTKNPKNKESEEQLRGVDANVNNQVAYALKKFEEEVKTGKLTVIGAIYDFQNALHQGQGRLVITNINGNTDAGNIMSGLMKLSGAGMTLDSTTSSKPKEKAPAESHSH